MLNSSPAYVNTAQVLAFQSAGHEVSAHTRTHPFLTQLSGQEMNDEIAGSRSDLLTAGLTPVDVFVYPYSDFNSDVIQATQDAGFIGARSTQFGFNTKATDKYILKSQSVEAITTLEQVKLWIDIARDNKVWLTLVFHQVDHSGTAYSTTPEILQGVVDYLSQQSIPIITLHEGLALMP